MTSDSEVEAFLDDPGRIAAPSPKGHASRLKGRESRSGEKLAVEQNQDERRGWTWPRPQST